MNRPSRVLISRLGYFARSLTCKSISFSAKKARARLLNSRVRETCVTVIAIIDSTRVGHQGSKRTDLDGNHGDRSYNFERA